MKKALPRAIETEGLAQFCGSRKELAHFKDVLEKVKFTRITSPSDACALYTYLFPNDDEREPWDVIAKRLSDMRRLGRSGGLQRKYGDSRFHVVVAQSAGDTVAYSQFSTLPVAGDGVIVYWQYGGVADATFMNSRYGRNEDFRIRGISSAFYPVRHGIAAADAASMGRKGVIGTLIESEFIGQAVDADDIRFTSTRLMVHNRSGMMVMMLDMGDGAWVTAHIQPRLGPDREPIILQALYRPLDIESIDLHAIREMDPGLAFGIMMSFIDNFDREGFGPQDVLEAREIISTRFKAANRVLLVPPERLPTIVDLCGNDPLLKEQVIRDYGSVDAQRARIRDAFVN